MEPEQNQEPIKEPVNNEPKPIPPKIFNGFKQYLEWFKSEEFIVLSDFILKAIKAFAPSAWVAFWDFMLVISFLATVALCANNGWIETRTTETLLILIIGTIIGAKFKSNKN